MSHDGTILVGIDDTDTIDTRGTNRIARDLIESIAARWRCAFLLRHQLFFDPRVPFTSQNGSASLELRPMDPARPPAPDDLFEELRAGLAGFFVEGSDPGLCLARQVPPEVIAYGWDCTRRIATQDEAHALAERHGIRLEGLGGTRDGVIGALAAVGLAASRDQGRVVTSDAGPDDLSGPEPVARVRARGVELFVDDGTGGEVAPVVVDVGKHLRPNRRAGRTVLFVETAPDLGPHGWRALRRH